MRVRVRGRVLIHGERASAGEILDVSAGGVRCVLVAPHPQFRLDDRVELELRFDGANDGWWQLPGHVVRCGAGSEIAVSFRDLPDEFEDVIQCELIASLESARVQHVLLVDPISARRGEIAASLRAGGCRVSEAATPLDAIARLGESRHQPRTVAIADTIPAQIADDLRDYLRLARRDLGLVRMMSMAS